MELNPYLMFNGRCEEAFRYYEKHLGGKIEAMFTYGNSPAAEHMPASAHHRIMHASLKVGDETLMGSDGSPDHPVEKPAGFSVSVNTKDVAEAEKIFAALSDKGVVSMPMAETFWSQRFGMCEDQFGIPWMVNCQKPPEGST